MAMHSREELQDIFEKYMSALNFPTEPAELYNPISYSLMDGGKRLRPMMLLMLADMCGGDINEALPCAAAVEVYHNFTLLHDDIMDNADVRRGKSSVYKKWGSNTAILSGDAMLIWAYRLLQQLPSQILPEVFAEFNKMALEVCEGQQFDLDFEKRRDVSIDEYMNMIRLKTAVLFASSSKMGGMVAGASAQESELLYRFGLEIGLAFQLQDDYLDTYGTLEVLGKNIGGDIAESKKTFLTITALHEAGDATRRAMLATFADNSLPLSHKMNRIKTIYDSLDVPEITRTKVKEHLDNATAVLDRFGEQGRDVAQMRAVVDAIANRNK